MQKAMTISEYRERFRAEEDCINYLMELKWGNGYKCRKCGCEEYIKGRQWFYKRCKKCRYDESPTANTIFQGCKLKLVKVFEVAYRLGVRKKGMSSTEFAREAGCQQRSAWLLKAKLQNAMESSGKYPLGGEVEVDEFLVGGFDEGCPGRSAEGKELVVLAVEKVTDKKGNTSVGRAYAKVIGDASGSSFRPFFEQNIDKDSKVATDGWRGYWPLMKNWEIGQKLSDKGKGFPELHTHIMNIKGWLRGIHHKCSAHRLQNYLDEFHFRFNRRNFLGTVLDKLLERAVEHPPSTYTAIKQCEGNT